MNSLRLYMFLFLSMIGLEREWCKCHGFNVGMIRRLMNKGYIEM